MGWGGGGGGGGGGWGGGGEREEVCLSWKVATRGSEITHPPCSG